MLFLMLYIRKKRLGLYIFLRTIVVSVNKNNNNKSGGDRVHVCVKGLKWGHTGVVHVASLP
jgi:hypothetical protein